MAYLSPLQNSVSDSLVAYPLLLSRDRHPCLEMPFILRTGTLCSNSASSRFTAEMNPSVLAGIFPGQGTGPMGCWASGNQPRGKFPHIPSTGYIAFSTCRSCAGRYLLVGKATLETRREEPPIIYEFNIPYPIRFLLLTVRIPHPRFPLSSTLILSCVPSYNDKHSNNDADEETPNALHHTRYVYAPFFAQVCLFSRGSFVRIWLWVRRRAAGVDLSVGSTAEIELGLPGVLSAKACEVGGVGQSALRQNRSLSLAGLRG